MDAVDGLVGVAASAERMDAVQMKSHTRRMARAIPVATDAKMGHISRVFTGVGQVDALRLCCFVTVLCSCRSAMVSLDTSTLQNHS